MYRDKRAEVMIFSSIDSAELINTARALVLREEKRKKVQQSFVLSKLCPATA
ncbi:MAG: hypothetical protein H6540_02515 [Bacteroidales bacterium]|nr:hypothetical protein [Bacteroidales bacterium]